MATVFDSATIAPQARLASLQRWHGWHGWHSNGWQSIAVGRSDQTVGAVARLARSVLARLEKIFQSICVHI
jgi:hypothetical protein